MTNFINQIYNIFKNKSILFLFVLLVLILFLASTYKLVETFDMSSLTSADTTTNTPVINEKYKYLAPLPDGSLWSTELQDKFVEKAKLADPNMTKDFLSLQLPFYDGKTLMTMASSEEAQFYIDNNYWPYDSYVTDFLNSTPDRIKLLETYQKSPSFPNRAVYNMFIKDETVPFNLLMTQIQGTPFSKPIKSYNDGSYWKCGTEHNLLTSDSETGTFSVNEDYNYFTKNIKDFQFDGEPCDICGIDKLPTETGGRIADVQLKKYNSPDNTCKFTISSPIPEAYDIYNGKMGVAISSANTTEPKEDYNSCISKCQQYKI